LTDQNGKNSQYELQIIKVKNNEVLFEVNVEKGQEISYSYTHSADGTPVEQIFEIDREGTLQLLEERYSWHGAGLETGPEKEITTKNGEVRVTGYDRSFPELPIRVARTIPQVINVGEKEVKLSDIAEAGASLTIRAQIE